MRIVLALPLLLVAGLVRPARAQGVAEVQVTPETLTLGIGQKQDLFAAAFDKQGNLLPTARFAFGSSDTTIARVSPEGTVVGLRAGLARIEVRAQERRVAVAVFVTAPGGTLTAAARDSLATASSAPAVGGLAAAIALDPAALSLLPGETGRFTARPLRGDGTPAAPVALTWKSLRLAVATVGSDGSVTGIAAGEGVIQVVGRGGLGATASVSVAPGDFVLSPPIFAQPPQMVDTLRAVVPLQRNRLIGGGLTWRSADSAVVRVGPTGIVQTLAPGEADVIASGFGQERRTHVIVYRRAEIFFLSPRPASGPVQVPLDGSVTVTARAEAADSSPVPQAPVVWEVGDSAIATFDPGAGRIIAHRLGTTSLTARLTGFDPAIWVIAVVPGDIALDRTRLGLPVGEHTSLAVAFADSQGGARGAPSGVTWLSDRPGIIAVGGDGTVSALAPGHATAMARTPWGRNAWADVFVTGDFLLSTNRQGKGFGIYQGRVGTPDVLTAVLVDTSANLQAVWSPDRTRIAFSSNRLGTYDLYVMDADGRNARALTSDLGSESEPAWTPDGARLIYSSARGGASQLHSIRADGEDMRPLTATPGGNGAAAVSPDGRTIAFTSARDGNQEIYIMDADGSNQRRITATPAREASPRFFPNGDLAYIVDRGGRGGSALVRQPAGSTVSAPLFEEAATIISFALSRDGTRVAYVTGRMAADSRGGTQFALFLRSLTPVGPAAPVSLGPAEQPVTPSF